MKSNFTNRAGAGRIGLPLLAGVILLFLGAMLIGCGQPQAVEPAAVPPVVVPGGQPALESPPALPTPAPTQPPPPSPTPPPTVDPAVLATAGAIQATQTAAAAPPTPPVTGQPQAAVTPTAEPLPTPSGVYSWTLKVPILMYHYISAPPDDADVYRVDLSTPPDAFREQMAWLKNNGYETIDLYDLTWAIIGYRELPDKPVMLTFDDGYLDNYENAYPILQEFGFQGTFFVITDFVDGGREGYMTWPMIEELARAGHRIESHSRTHPDLREKDHDGLIWEILGAQETIAAHTGQRPRYFCYPGGDYDETTIAMLQELDYWGAVTTANGSWHGFNNRFEWERLRMQNSTTMHDFARMLDLEGTVRGKPPG